MTVGTRQAVRWGAKLNLLEEQVGALMDEVDEVGASMEASDAAEAVEALAWALAGVRAALAKATGKLATLEEATP
jgi:hypothetical protein